MSIELRLSDVDPPDPDPPRTIYRDVLNLPDPVKLGITVRYFNYDDVGLYFQITGSAPGYTFGTVNLNGGAVLGSGANKYENLDEFGSRAKPVAGDFTNGEFDESITLILRAYTDAGYTDLKWTHERTVTVVWIKSDDPAWTLDPWYPEGNSCNFDDGTVQGWAVTTETGGPFAPTLAVVSDYVLSAPYSIKMKSPYSDTIGWSQQAGRLYKSFTTPNKDVVYAIIDLRTSVDVGSPVTGGTVAWNKFLKVNRDGTVLVYLGRPYDTVESNYFPKNKWMRIVVPLPKNVTIEIRIIHDILSWRSATSISYGYLWLDDFKIISK